MKHIKHTKTKLYDLWVAFSRDPARVDVRGRRVKVGLPVEEANKIGDVFLKHGADFAWPIRRAK